ncbi:Pyridine nucleotide-disulphide oxidoreductase family protein, related [Neospora caninum Liverpool]|uniref:monodehydroascorbate reductase (NADH) n=1 Tax=Neospora caninum (strain Liverpool) TaxID=572307 RepID=F0VHD4_NEOCL|nr:Pyridine nucleotide-disulphide oxidoreductase family protein, related [Neospora caninum Liverpool]CBZ53128.1 Pyridine nucleotide-disulphide oxidoreductase family protein, related [Neospora caninum Liverpool]CEL67116.1 TPA: Pyridine nucleotide-disulphide oxidoreductase family protein, related [Neospora caninum Liverpool]|eukprot:XP_003883160.1 Pyridine nucleotide-disulphide oxidoreductase family protein, related [Neospora caninum Liverpool]
MASPLESAEDFAQQLSPPAADPLRVKYLVVGGGVAAGYFFHYFAEPLQQGRAGISGKTAGAAAGNVAPGSTGNSDRNAGRSLDAWPPAEGTRGSLCAGERAGGKETKRDGQRALDASKDASSVRAAPYPTASRGSSTSRAQGLAQLSLQEQDAKLRFLLVSSEAVLPYERPALSKGFLLGKANFPNFNVAAGISGAIQDAQWYIARGVHVLLNETVSSVDLANRSASLQSSQRTVYFDKLIVATGLRPVDFVGLGMWNLRGVPFNIFTFRFASEAKQIVDFVKQIQARSCAALNQALPSSDNALGTADASKGSAVVLGSGFTGTEVAAALCQLGLKVVMVTHSARILSKIFTPELSGFYEKQFEQRGVTVIKNASVQNLVRDVDSDSRVSAVRITDSDGSSHVLEADFVVAALGSRPVVEFLNRQVMLADECVGGGIQVDEHLQAFPSREVQIAAASAQNPYPEVFAIGDVAAFPHSRVGGRPVRYEHVWNARSMAAYLAKHLRWLERKEEQEARARGDTCNVLQEAEEEETVNAAALAAAEDGQPQRAVPPGEDSDSAKAGASNRSEGCGSDTGYQFLPIYYSRIFDLSWKFFGFRRGTPVLVNDFDRQISRKIIALWIDSDQTVQGAFLEGGNPEEEELLRRAADSTIVVSPEAVQQAKDVAEVLKLIRHGVEQLEEHRTEAA